MPQGRSCSTTRRCSSVKRRDGPGRGPWLGGLCRLEGGEGDENPAPPSPAAATAAPAVAVHSPATAATGPGPGPGPGPSRRPTPEQQRVVDHPLPWGTPYRLRLLAFAGTGAACQLLRATSQDAVELSTLGFETIWMLDDV